MTLQVREYATLTCAAAANTSMDFASISEPAFDWLLDLRQPDKNSSKLFKLSARKELKLGSYVGYIETPTGESLEILPKTEQQPTQNIEAMRSLLQKMLKVALGVNSIETRAADLRAVKQPLHEWIFSEFLAELTELVRRGLRFDYLIKEDEATFIRGQLDMNRQMRQTPEKAGRFHVRYADFTPERIENRLLRTTLDYVLQQTRSSQNWRMANMLSHQLSDIAPVIDPLNQIHNWVDSKLLLPYRKVRPWCQLILEKLNPNFQKGKKRGIALVFPMEQLYEQYLGHCLAGQLNVGFKITPQASTKSLVTHLPVLGSSEREMFQMKPDFLLTGKQSRFVLDAKWKLIDAYNDVIKQKYGISQSDLYQMFAYGHKYQAGQGSMMLIYPKHTNFTEPLPVFHFDDSLSLWCIPFDLEKGELIAGDWQEYFDCFRPTSGVHIRKAG